MKLVSQTIWGQKLADLRTLAHWLQGNLTKATIEACVAQRVSAHQPYHCPLTTALLCIISWKPGKILLKERYIWHSGSLNHEHGYYQDIELFTLLVYNRNRFLIT